MHARKTARDALFPSREDDAFFAPRRGDIVFRDSASVRAFADRLNRGENRDNASKVTPAELGAMALMHEVLHAVIARYRLTRPASFRRLSDALYEALGPLARKAVLDFLGAFPPPPVYRTLRGEGELTPSRFLEVTGEEVELELDEEILLLWVTNQNPAYRRVRSLVGDDDLGPSYRAFVHEARRFFAEEPSFGPGGESLFDLLLQPGEAHPGSILEQVGYVEESWGTELGLEALPFWDDVQRVHDLKAEEDKYFARGGPGPGEPLLEAMTFEKRPEDEPAQFSPDLGWMPNVVLIAKSVYVWLDQLSKKYDREIERLDQIPDEELDLLKSQHMTGLWLIGLFERSRASQRVKQMRGDTEALASAYSLASYNIAAEIGGYTAYENLKKRAWVRGIRLAADMVPNHVGIDGDWVIEHPEWFLQTRIPPFPAYRFGGPDLCQDRRVGVNLEEGYWSMTDAAVVYRRHDRLTGEDRFLYHGNDGTSMPWNDTAQLDYLQAEVRRAVIETILHVARMFPIIRFDAAMTLAKRHIQRLWFPLPGKGAEAIPSRADYAMTQEEFDAAIPIEFWREVVDTVAERAPDTLLLAEAFWMMEGYFVRTLGMHRVYNSAFMNMLKREENEKYKATITNVLDFDPEILKRFVNFMNNPDEETAISQFGANDKYFGVCAMMATMPGLPMFGHGQIEGLREKYGMEYRRAKFDERPNPYVVARHEREIFPLLAKRYLFSGVQHFALYDFMSGGHVDHDVYAYSNGSGKERALVLFNNRHKSTRGRIYASTHRGNLAQELGLDEDLGWWLVIRDMTHGLEYLRPTKDVVDAGMAWELEGYQYHVLTGWRQVTATVDRPYDRLAAALGGRGVPDVDLAVRELYLRPIHAPLREACSKGHLAYLAVQLDAPSDVAARAALEERLGHVVDGLDWMLTQRSQRDVTIDRTPAFRRAGERFASLHAFARQASAAEALAADAMTSSPRSVPLAPPVPRATLEGVPPRTEAIAPAKLLTPLPTAPVAEPVGAAPPSTPARSREDSDSTIAAAVTSSAEPGEAGSSANLLLAYLQLEAVIEILAAGAEAFEEARSRPPAYLSARAIIFRPEPSSSASIRSMSSAPRGYSAGLIEDDSSPWVSGPPSSPMRGSRWRASLMPEIEADPSSRSATSSLSTVFGEPNVEGTTISAAAAERAAAESAAPPAPSAPAPSVPALEPDLGFAAASMQRGEAARVRAEETARAASRPSLPALDPAPRDPALAPEPRLSERITEPELDETEAVPSPSESAIPAERTTEPDVGVARARPRSFLGAAPSAPPSSGDLASALEAAPLAWAGLPWGTREKLIEEWQLATPMLEAFGTAVAEDEAKRRTALVILAATLPSGALTPAVRLAIGTRRGQVFLDVHEADGVYWLNKERYEELVGFLAERETGFGRLAGDVATAERATLVATAESEGYRAEKIAHRLGPPPAVE